MRRASVSVLITLVAAMLLPLVPRPAVAAPPTTPAKYSRAAMSRDELAILPEALGKVIKTGKVAGTIDAAVGDIVMPASASVPDDYAGPAPTLDDTQRTAGTTPAATAAATVLHAYWLRVFQSGAGPGGQEARIRTLSAIEENTAKEARGYFRARLVYGDTGDTTWSTYHQLHFFRVHRGDQDNSEADGCASTPNAHCTWTKDPPDCRGPSPTCDVYLVVGTYRPKGNGPDVWLTEVYDYQWWQPADNAWWRLVQCPPDPPSWAQGQWWRVGDNASLNPSECPYRVGV